MARVTYGAIITELKGSISKTTFQNNVSGNIMKSKAGSRLTNSSLQYISQSNFTAINYLWSNLNASDKQSWVDFAAANDYISQYGITKKLSGYQYFVSCNSNILLVGEAPLTTAPVFISIPVFPSFGFNVNSGIFNLEINVPVTLANSFIAVYATSLIRSVIVQSRKNYRFIYSIANDTTDELVLKDSYQNAFGLLWSDIINSNHVSIVISCKYIEALTGLSGKYFTNVQSFPLP